MEISPIRLFYLLLSSFFLGVGVGAVYDVHRIVRIFFGVQYSKKRPSELLLRPLPMVGRPLGEIRQRKWKNCFLSVLIFLQDVFFFCLAGVGIVILNYAYNDGQFRFYTVVALLFGFLSYYFTIGKLVIYLSEWIVFFLRAAFSILFFLLFAPLAIGAVINIEKFLEDLNIFYMVLLSFCFLSIICYVVYNLVGLVYQNKKLKNK
jgi:hypothetical protein